MSIFGRKEIAQLKKELETSNKRNEVLQSEVAEFKEKYSRYFSALNQSNKEIENYKSELLKANTEAQDYKRKYAELLANTPEFTIPGQISADAAVEELARLKEKCADYEKSLNSASYENAKYRQDISDLQAQIKELEIDYNQNVKGQDSENTNEPDNQNEDANNKVYHIRNIVKSRSYYMDKVYRSKSDFFHSFKKDKASNEYKMYRLLLSVIYEIKSDSLINIDGECIRLSLFSQVRLADIVELQCSTFDKFKNDLHRKNICGMIEGKKPDFDNEDYKKAFLNPLLNKHIDFLICINEKTQCVPLLAIELHGLDHDENSKFADEKRIRNDKFKKALFESEKVDVELLIVKNEELNNKEIKDSISKTIIKCLEKRKNVIRI